VTRNTETDEAELAAIVLEAVNRLPGGFVIYGPNHEILLANEQNERDFRITNQCLRAGLSHHEAICAAVRDVMPGLAAPEVEAAAQHIASALNSGEPVELKTANGKIMQVIELPLSFGGSMGVGADITALRERERELKNARKAADAANEAKSAFLANMSHELRTPLNGILGMTHLLASSDLTDEQRDQIETILDSGQTLMAILNDVLDLSKIEAGKFDISPIDHDLSQLLDRLNKLWAPQASEKGLTLTLELDPAMKSNLRFDPIRVRQCISNLVSNAIKFTSRGSIKVSASVRPTGDGLFEATLSVTDTGIGMDGETMGRLFAPFSQGDATTARNFGGTGLGLSISRKLARLMGGDVTVTSEAGKGSTFTLTFQAEAGAVAEEAVTEEDTQASSDTRRADGIRLLLVDDHPLNRKVARVFLEPLNIHVTEAVNGEEALFHLDAQEFDLVLLDMHMPVMDGRETLRRIRAEGSPHRDLGVIVLTADSLGPDNTGYEDMGADGYIHKPMDHRDLIREIGRVLEKRHGHAPVPAKAIPNLCRA